MGNISKTEAAAVIPALVASQMVATVKQKAIAANLVTRDFDNEVAAYGDSIKVGVRGALSVNDKSEDTDVTLQTPTATAVTVTLNKHKEVSFVIEDVARAMARPDLLAGYVADGAAKIAEQVDADLLALYASLANDSSTTGTAISGDVVLSARQELLTNGKSVAESSIKRLMVGYAAQTTLLKDDDVKEQLIDSTKGGNRDVTASNLERAYTGRFFDIDVYASSAVTNQHAILFTPEAFALVTRPLPVAPAGLGVEQQIVTVDGITMRVTMSYQPKSLGMLVTIDLLYGVAILSDNYAVEVLHS